MRKISLALAVVAAAGLASTGASAGDETVVSSAKLDVAVAPATAAASPVFTMGGVGFSQAAVVGLGFAGASLVTFTAVANGDPDGVVIPGGPVIPDVPSHFGAPHSHRR